MAKAVTTLKCRADETAETTAQVITHAVQNLTQAAQGQMPNAKAMRKTIRRTRVANFAAPIDNPRTLIELNILPDSPLRLYEHHPEQCKKFVFGAKVEGAEE